MIVEISQTFSNYKLLDIILDLDFAIENCGMLAAEYERLDYWMMGYTECEIADLLNLSQNTIHKSIISACEKISKLLK